MDVLLKWFESHSGTGSWLQGIATMGALWFALVEVTAAGRIDRRRQLVRLARVRSLLSHGREVLDQLARNLSGSVTRRDVASTARNLAVFGDVEAIEGALAAVPIHEEDEWAVAHAVYEGRAALLLAKKCLVEMGKPDSELNPRQIIVAQSSMERATALANAKTALERWPWPFNRLQKGSSPSH